MSEAQKLKLEESNLWMTSNQRKCAKLTFYVFPGNRNPRMALPLGLMNAESLEVQQDAIR
jgi:hypothetical protein